MQIFTNKFNIAMNMDKTEVIINFSQHVPIMPSDNDELTGSAQRPTFENIPVSKIVMTGQQAKNLVTLLSNMLEEEIPQN